MRSFVLQALAASGVAAGAARNRRQQEAVEPNAFTATSAAAVHAAQATAKTSSPTSNVPGVAFDRFITIWMENTDFTKAQADPNLAWLATKGISLTNYFGVTHPSEPNYVASLGGDNFGMDNDNFNQIPANISSVIDLLENRGISWGTYQEDMPYTGYEGYSWVNQKTKANDYVRKHNPPIIYNANTSPDRLAVQKNLTMFYSDLEAQTLPQWAFITPNMTNDGHDTSVTVAGQFVRSFLEPLLDNEYFMKNTLILVTFDENHTYTIGNRVFSILLGGAVPASKAGTTDSNFYDHYSEISTVEANWNLHTLGRWDVGANVFNLVAQKSGDIYRPWDEVTGSSPSVFLNSSFAGPYNTGFETAPFPAPNTMAVSPMTGRTVLPQIASSLAASDFLHLSRSYYNNGVQIPDGQHPPSGYAYNSVSN